MKPFMDAVPVNLLTNQNNKNRIIFIGTILVISLFFIVNLLALFVYLDLNSVRYWLLILTCLLIILTLSLEKDNLADFHIDRISIIILITFGTIFHRRLLVPNEIIYQITLWILSVYLLYFLIRNWNSIPGMKLQEIIILSFVLLIFLLFINYLENSLHALPSHILDKSPILYVIRDLIFEFSFTASMEEFLFRGILWGILIRYGFSLRKVFFVQGFVFWLLHFRVEYPAIFFVLLPLCAVFYSLLIVKFKRLFPAVLSHALVNAVTAYL